ncbi:MAG: hypothetical protein K2W95_26665 [Candidatus Obscuribacterales bacterium]|nr:hypothetical protein [Candidatus Obscuribacterales bacterium]
MFIDFELTRLLPATLSVLTVLSIMPAGAGQLSVGTNATAKGEINLSLVRAISLNGRTRVEIISARRKAVAKYPLFSGTYSPSEPVFGLVEDKKPWWGYYGMYVYRQGLKSPLGPSKESRFIFNPYLLVAADPTVIGLINPKKVTPEILKTPDFPFVWEPKNLRWWPEQARAEVTYDVSGFQKQVAKFKQYLKEGDYFINKFSLIAYNARDLGFNYIYPDIARSNNVENRYAEKTPIKIAQMIHCGGSCGFPGGCNNMSPLMPELDFMRLTDKPPATLVISLWRDQPRSVTAKPDFTYTIKFE